MSVQTDTLASGTLPTDNLDAQTPTDLGTASTMPPPLTGVVSGANDSALPPPTTLAQEMAQQASGQVADTQGNLAGSTTTGATGPPIPGGAKGPPIPGGTGIGAKVVAAAMGYLGTPYVWGGTSAAGLDCSGLVQLAYKAAGINLPRVSFQQATYGTSVSLKDLRPGDLVAWQLGGPGTGADHIAIYAGNGYVIEAPHPGGHVQYVPIWNPGQAFGVRMPW